MVSRRRLGRSRREESAGAASPGLPNNATGARPALGKISPRRRPDTVSRRAGGATGAVRECVLPRTIPAPSLTPERRAWLSPHHGFTLIMPTYEYSCGKCDHHFELSQPMSASAIATCPKELCGMKKWGKGKVKRAISGGAGLLFKGSGFYITDYRSENYKAAAKKDSAGGGGESSGSAKTDSTASSATSSTTSATPSTSASNAASTPKKTESKPAKPAAPKS